MSLLSYETSQNMLDLLEIPSLRYENIGLHDALGRVLAQDIVTEYNDPKFPTASMDGYALSFADQEIETLSVVGINPAGNDEKRVVQKGTCIKTFTGSKMPEGTDTLIPIENVTFLDNTIQINEKVSQGFAVRPIAEGFKEGDILIKQGTKLGFVEIGILAALNCVHAKVVCKPRVAVLATGSEVLDLGMLSQSDAQIRSSNNYTLAALFNSVGAQSVQLGVVGDDKSAILKEIENGLAVSDILVTTGGVSVGDFDFVKEIVPRIGAEVIYKGIAIKPGRHILLAKKGEKFIVALPGFAYSSTVTAILYVLPLIAKMLGKENPYKIVAAKLKEDFRKRSTLTEFSACNITIEDGAYFVDFQNKKVGSSAILTNLLGESGLMVSAEEDTFLEVGTCVNVILLENF
ncbi:MAG: molybdopterin molybdotransferase MoeA [Sulfurimonadaceae bacterium]|jgi:molybdopterin molybdotransferase|nr:molybdopterin molybdotransferase MoeA [Sulfurimonadaceae bacterium]